MAKYRTATPDEWNPPVSSSGRKRDELDEQMGVLEEGQVLIIEAEDEKELRGKRLALGRRAKALGMAIEQYSEGLTITARRKDAAAPAPPPPAPEPAKRRPGRKRREESEGVARPRAEAAVESGETGPTPPESVTT